ncbi:MAG: type II secretion system F family protein [Rhodoferax sp.]
MRQVAQGGSTVLRCEPVQPSAGQAWLLGIAQRLRPMQRIDTVAFAQDMATLLGAGVSIKEAVAALLRHETVAATRTALDDVNLALSQGRSLSAALKDTQAFPELLVATIAASEQTGDLVTALARYTQHQQGLRTVRDRVVGACVYPLLLLVVGLLVVALLLGVVVPRFAVLIESTGKELPLLSRLLLGWGQMVDAHPWIPALMLCTMVAAFAGAWWQLAQPDTRKQWLARLPGISQVVREFQHLQMYRTTAILTARGVAIHKALVYSLEFLDVQDQARLTLALEHMRQGATVSDALSRCGLSDVVATSMIHVAQRTGAMPEVLDRIADFYERSLQRKMDLVSRLIEPLLMIIFGSLIGGIVVLMYLPIFDLASSIS